MKRFVYEVVLVPIKHIGDNIEPLDIGKLPFYKTPLSQLLNDFGKSGNDILFIEKRLEKIIGMDGRQSENLNVECFLIIFKKEANV